ncbi:MAG TPA: class I SAM-dependent methyltransferase [Bryobacteraceae bacterium]|nr:class I SAM-dependent methyltransferase [Bryobacteraceae bacterium]
MSRYDTPVTEQLGRYIAGVSLRQSDVLRRLREEVASYPNSSMQISAEQGQFLQLLIRMLGAKRTLEIGVFTGYSSLSVALALPPDGRIVACDVSEPWTSVARRYWREAGVEGKIELHLAPAVETLDRLLAEGAAGSFDFAFIDADKLNYDNYYERCLELVRRGGLIAVDNTLWHGRVVDDGDQTPDTLAIRAFNDKLHEDQRIWLSLVPIGDGLTLALKK